MKMRWIIPSALMLCTMLAYAAETDHGLKLDPQKTYSVRLVLVGQMRLLNIGEIQVFSGDTNIALACKASMSSSPEAYPAATWSTATHRARRQSPVVWRTPTGKSHHGLKSCSRRPTALTGLWCGTASLREKIALQGYCRSN
jgi:hypothetical protein